MQFDLKSSIEILRRTPGVLRAMLAGLDRQWTHSNYGKDTFSPFDVVGHLIAGEKNDWLNRVKILLEHGESRPFDPVDRYAQFEDSRGKSLDHLLNEFERLRKSNMEALVKMGLTENDYARRGVHPAFGSVTLSNLLSTWVAHDLNHIAQIAKCMATQYEEAVGPWREFLGVLRTPVTRMDAEGASRRAVAMNG